MESMEKRGMIMDPFDLPRGGRLPMVSAARYFATVDDDHRLENDSAVCDLHLVKMELIAFLLANTM